MTYNAAMKNSLNGFRKCSLRVAIPVLALIGVGVLLFASRKVAADPADEYAATLRNPGGCFIPKAAGKLIGSGIAYNPVRGGMFPTGWTSYEDANGTVRIYQFWASDQTRDCHQAFSFVRK